MNPYKASLRLGVLAGASALALALAAPVMANDKEHSSSSTVSVPQSPDVGHGYRPDPARKTVGQMEQEIAEGKYSTQQRSGDMNKIGETSSGRTVQPGTPLPSGSARPMGDATSPGSGGDTGAFPNSAANLQVERVNIADLPPDLQAAVRSRMDRQQTPSELVETTILNRLALMGSEYKLDSAQKVGANYVLRVSTPGGTQTTMLYETSSGTLRQVQM